MAKRKLHHLHRIKVHHNRWLIWAIAYVLIVTIALIGYVKVSQLYIDAEPESVYEPMHSYTDSRLGFALRYPADWGIEAENTSISFLPSDSSDNGVTVTVVTPNSESSVRRALKITKETAITLGDATATKYINDLGNGHSETVVIATHNKKLFVVRGSEPLVQKLLVTFHFVIN